ncbi:MAG TPA: NADH-quinone oxidoreductase subunit J [Thermoanaerobaculia bacterium]|jgi:NADH-quinone oxidoreductase subunit J|nr:NADH-quinone oxidoreductase subunit J [Thermoanaerobaculia bacterium]
MSFLAGFLQENGAALLFYLFAGLALAGAVGVVTFRSPMNGALSLLVTFLAVAALFLLRHAGFVGIVQIFVYGGGIMVLFLFVIMLVNLNRLEASERVWRQTPWALLLSLLFAGVVGVVARANWGQASAGSAERLRTLGGEVVGNPQALAGDLFRNYLLPFEIASLFLLVAMVGAVVLGRRE